MFGYSVTRWWRVVAPDGKTWCETSDEKEARDCMREGDKLQRLFSKTEFQWMDVEEKEK